MISSFFALLLHVVESTKLTCFYKHEDHPRYVEANAGCKHFDVYGGPDSNPISRNVFDAKV